MDDLHKWEYRVVVFKIYDVSAFERRLSDFGRAGWELVTLSTTVKTWLNVTGNDLVAVLKRPSPDLADRDFIPAVEETVPAGWYADPRRTSQAAVVGRHGMERTCQ
jgi:hypothetical protein